MSNDEGDVLSAYIERSLALRPQNQDELSPGQLREIALELGLTESDLARADEQAQQHSVRAESMAAHGRYEDAITEYREALILRPEHLETMSALAWVHRRNWGSTGQEESRAAARSLAYRCLAIEPQHDDALRLLNELDGPPAVWRGPKRGTVIAAVALGLSALGGAIGGGWWLLTVLW